MADKLTQQCFDFTPSRREAPAAAHAASARPGPGATVTGALARLEAWLKDPHTGTMTGVAEEALHALRRALLEGKNGYWHKAEDLLEALASRNGRTAGEDIPAGMKAAEGEDFHRAVEDLLDLLHERWVGSSPTRYCLSER